MDPIVLDAPPSTRSQRKLAQIMEAAGRLFREHGYGMTTMDAVARDADVSKATLYAYFAGKRELFAAVISDEGDRHSGALLAGEDSSEDIDASLLRFGRSVQQLLMAPETISSYRMVVSEAGRLPELGRDYYVNGAARLLARLEAYFAHAMERGVLRTANPRRAAEQFIGLVRGDLMLCALLGVEDRITEEQKNAVARAGVDTFLRAYRRGTDGSKP
jgi:AcrR family transcriptional regulator